MCGKDGGVEIKNAKSSNRKVISNHFLAASRDVYLDGFLEMLQVGSALQCVLGFLNARVTLS